MVVPLAELVVLIQVGGLIGAPATILLVLATSIAGVALVRHEGRRAWRDFRAAVDAGRWPGDEVARGAFVLAGGALLVLPGFLTDAVGLALLIPVVGDLVARIVRGRLAGRPSAARGTAGPAVGAGRDERGRARPPRGSSERAPGVLDVEVIDVRRDDGDQPAGR